MSIFGAIHHQIFDEARATSDKCLTKAIRAGIDKAIVDKALFTTVDKHASLSTKLKNKYNNNNSEERLISHEITA